MATKKFYHDIDLVSVGQLVNARIHNVTTAEKTTLAESLTTTHKGFHVYDTTVGAAFIWNGSAFEQIGLSVEGDIVFKGTLDPGPTGIIGAPTSPAAGYQYVVSATGTLNFGAMITVLGDTNVEAGDVVLFTSATEAVVLQRNNDAAISALQSDVSDLQTGLSTAQTDISSLSTDVSTLQSGLSTAQTDISSLQTTVGQVQTDLSDLNSGLTSAQTSISNLETGLGSAQTAIGTLQTDFASAQTVISNISSGLSTAQTDISSLQTGMTSAQTDISNLVTDVNTVESGLSTAQTDITNLQSAVSTAQTDISTLQTDVTAVETTVAELPRQYFATINIASNSATTINHNLNLVDQDAFVINCMHANSQASFEVTSLSHNSLQVGSAVELNGVKVTIIGAPSTNK